MSVTINVNTQEVKVVSDVDNVCTISVTTLDFAETDPVFQASEASKFVAGDKQRLDDLVESNLTEHDPVWEAEKGNYLTKTEAGDTYIPKNEKGVANGVATLGSDGKIPSEQLNNLAITTTYVVASQDEQLALNAQEGDVCVRTDEKKSYIHNGGTSSTMDDWTLLETPTDAVLSVFGRTGNITAQAGDYTAEQVGFSDPNFTATNAKDAITEVNGKSGKVLASATDTTLGTLDQKVDTTTIEVSNNKLQVKPDTFANKTHTHPTGDIVGLNDAIANNSDVLANTNHRGLTDNPHNVVAGQVGVDTTNFTNNLSSADTTVQKALETLDQLSAGGSYPTITVGTTGDYATVKDALVAGAKNITLLEDVNEVADIDWTYNDVTIDLAGHTWGVATVTDALIHITANVDNVTIKNGAINESNFADNDAFIKVDTSITLSNLIIDGIKVDNSNSSTGYPIGLFISDTSTTLKNVYIRNCDIKVKYIGMYVRGYLDNVRIYNNKIEGLSQNMRAIYIYSAGGDKLRQGFYINNNDIYQPYSTSSALTYGIGLYMYSTSDTYLVAGYIVNNRIIIIGDTAQSSSACIYSDREVGINILNNYLVMQTTNFDPIGYAINLYANNQYYRAINRIEGNIIYAQTAINARNNYGVYFIHNNDFRNSYRSLANLPTLYTACDIRGNLNEGYYGRETHVEYVRFEDAVSAGDVVVWLPDAYRSRVQKTTTVNDPLLAGVAITSVSAGGYGWIVTKGLVRLTRFDVDEGGSVSAGDLLCTGSTAGYLIKSTTKDVSSRAVAMEDATSDRTNLPIYLM